MSNELVKPITHISLKPFGYGLVWVGLPILTALRREQKETLTIVCFGLGWFTHFDSPKKRAKRDSHHCVFWFGLVYPF